jgi:hypothetical protein
MIPEPQNVKPLRLEPRSPVGILKLTLGMLTAIDFNDHSPLKTDKIHDVGTDRLLPPQSMTIRLPKT